MTIVTTICPVCVGTGRYTSGAICSVCEGEGVIYRGLKNEK